MIHLDDAAQGYLSALLQQQDIAGLAVRMRAVKPGTPQADCRLEFCEPEELQDSDFLIEYGALRLVVDAHSMPYLHDTQVSYLKEATGGQLTIKAPRLKHSALPPNASVLERVQQVLETEINPQVASHGGNVSLLELSADGVLRLRFGGGCQGCGMKDVTLKQGVEKTLLARVPELTAIIDATDHSAGENPYFRA